MTVKYARRSANNFWQQKLIDADVSLKDMAELIGCSYKYTVAYFTGFVHPTDETITTICDLLSVPVEFGKQKFDEIYEAWGKAHKSTYMKFSNTYKRIPSEAQKTKEKQTRVITMGFWHHKIAGSDMTVKELAITLGKPYPTTNAYFTGYILPDKETAKKICILFNVDFERGYQEFLKAHDKWGLVHADNYVKCGNTYKMKPKKVRKVRKVNKVKKQNNVAPVVEEIPVDVVPTPVPETTVVPVIEEFFDKHYNSRSKTLRMQQLLYSILSYDDFLTVLSLTSTDAVMRLAYDKVEFDVFKSLTDIYFE